MLVGGTALSGFYAQHRRSDDLDLFVKDDFSFESARRACMRLPGLGVDLRERQRSRDYYHALCTLRGHSFTLDIVVDENVFRIGGHHTAGERIVVADLPSLFKMKVATLLSRCSEKDLYDLIWLFQQFEEVETSDLISMGAEIDAGMDAETLLFSIASAPLSEEACDFSLDPAISEKVVYKQIKSFQQLLIGNLQDYLEDLPPPPMKELVERLRRL